MPPKKKKSAKAKGVDTLEPSDLLIKSNLEIDALSRELGIFL